MKKQKMYYLSIILTFVLAVMVFTLPIHSLATDHTETYHYNRNYLINFIPHTNFGSTSISHFNEALYNWNQKAGTTLLKRDPTVRHSTTDYPNNDGIHKIYKATKPSIPYPGITQPYTVSTFAKTTSESSYSLKNVITSADILINTNYSFVNSTTPASGYFDVWTVFVHEAGHVLGLAHTTNSSLNSVMETFINGGVSRRYPSTSDGNKLNSWLVTLQP